MEVAEARPGEGARGVLTGSQGEQLTYLRAAFEHSPVGLAVFDATLRIVALNAAGARLNGLPVEAHLGRTLPEVLPGLEDVQVTLERVLETGEPMVGARYRSPDPTSPASPASPAAEVVREISSSRLDGPDGDVLGVVAVVADVTAREKAQQAFADAQFRLALVNEASVRVSSSLDVRRTAEELTELVVPRFADIAMVDLLESMLVADVAPSEHEEETPLLRTAARARERHLAERLPQPVGSRVMHPAGSPPAAALARGSAVLVERTGPVDLDGTEGDRAPGGEEAAYAGAIGVTSLLFAPLVARGTVLGVAALGRFAGSPPFRQEDLALADELAARAALAIDNARLYRRERATAVALQRSLLPQGRPALTGIEVASRYSPGSVDSQVGGDWFDVVPLSGGRVALVVGDVMGRGLRAAAVMGQLRIAVRTLAVLDLLPDDVLAHLDHVAQSLDGVQLATCVYAVYDPVARVVTFAAAGHPPLALLDPDGGVQLLQPPSGAPLGVGGVPFEAAEVALPDDSTLVLYTDGLVESRHEDLDAGLAALRRVLDGPVRTLDALCDAILRGLGRDGAHEDDVALLVSRMTGVPPERTRSWEVPLDLTAVAASRRGAARALVEWGIEGLADLTTLLISEMVTNAIRYARGPVVVRLVLLDRDLFCSVQDGDTRLPRLRRAGFEDEGGRGLHLVGMLARRWGARPTAGGKDVWFELPLPRGRS